MCRWLKEMGVVLSGEMEGSNLDVFARKARRECMQAITLETVVQRWTWEMHQRRLLERVAIVDSMQSGHAELITTTLTNISYWEKGMEEREEGREIGREREREGVEAMIS